MRRAGLAAIVAGGLVVGSGAARAEMIGDELAAQIADTGCAAEEEALLEAWLAQGFGVDGFREQMEALEQRGVLVRGEDAELRLVGWGECA